MKTKTIRNYADSIATINGSGDKCGEVVQVNQVGATIFWPGTKKRSTVIEGPAANRNFAEANDKIVERMRKRAFKATGEMGFYSNQANVWVHPLQCYVVDCVAAIQAGATADLSDDAQTVCDLLTSGV